MARQPASLTSGLVVFSVAMQLIVAAVLTQSAAAPAIPNATTLTMLIRTTLIALNHANSTGNYTVLRELGSPSFRAAHSSANLAVIFSPLRAKKADLSPVVVLAPQLSAKPGFSRTGRLILTGFFPSAPMRVRFQIGYEVVAGRWRLSLLSANLVPVKQVNNKTSQAQTKKKARRGQRRGSVRRKKKK